MKQIVAAIVALPAVSVIVWYVVSFLPCLDQLNEFASKGMAVTASASSAFYPLAIAGESERGIRIYAVRQAHGALVAEDDQMGSARRQLSEALWLAVSYIHFNEVEMFGIWVECSLSDCERGLMNASERYFHKPIQKMTEEELAGLVALVKGPSAFAPGSERGERRKQMILEKYRAGS